MVNYNKNTNKVIAIQYLYDRNKTHTKHKHNIGNFGSTSNNINGGTIGDYNNQSKDLFNLIFSSDKTRFNNKYFNLLCGFIYKFSKGKGL